MKIYFEEKIGNPELFTGRKKEMKYFLNWTRRIKQKLSMRRGAWERGNIKSPGERKNKCEYGLKRE